MLPGPSPLPEIAPSTQLSPGRFPPPPAPSSTSSLGSEKPLLSPSRIISYGSTQISFTYEQLSTATNGFSTDNFLGQGGFSNVHKGVLPDKKPVAIKQLKDGSRQGEREFLTEIEIISRIHHRHLVSLVGYCISGTRRMLVYEFVPNNNLHFHLHGNGGQTISWATRKKIALGSARGLAYLHEDCQPKIIHRDIKAANILLDYNFEVADFGLAKFSPDADTHILTGVKGTSGYLAPEYASSGKLTNKSDVFSFGVVLLELITGRLPFDKTRSSANHCLTDWAKPLLTQARKDGNVDTLVDRRLQKNYNSNEMNQMVACATASVHPLAQNRPRMSQIVRALEGSISLDDLNEGIRLEHNTILESQEHNISEPIGYTGTYSLHPSSST